MRNPTTMKSGTVVCFGGSLVGSQSYRVLFSSSKLDMQVRTLHEKLSAILDVSYLAKSCHHDVDCFIAFRISLLHICKLKICVNVMTKSCASYTVQYMHQRCDSTYLRDVDSTCKCPWLHTWTNIQCFTLKLVEFFTFPPSYSIKLSNF